MLPAELDQVAAPRAGVEQQSRVPSTFSASAVLTCANSTLRSVSSCAGSRTLAATRAPSPLPLPTAPAASWSGCRLDLRHWVRSNGAVYWPRTGEQFTDAAYAMARVQATLACMSTATLKRELALLRSSLAALTPSQSAALDDPIAWAERIAGLTLDPWQRDVLLSASPRLLLNATRQSGKSTVAALKAAWTVLQGGLAVVVSPSLRQSGFLFRKLARHLVASEAAFRRETMTEVELVSGGLAVSLPGDRPAMLRGLSLRHDGPAVLIVDEASRVRDELWATISPMLAAAPAAQQILLSTPAGASGEFHRAWSSGEDWERVQITADQCPRISAEHLAAERIRLGDALYRQEYFGAFVSAPGSVFDAEVLAHMFGDDTEEERDEPASMVQGRIADRFLQ